MEGEPAVCDFCGRWAECRIRDPLAICSECIERARVEPSPPPPESE